MKKCEEYHVKKGLHYSIEWRKKSNIDMRLKRRILVDFDDKIRAKAGYKGSHGFIRTMNLLLIDIL
jgi:hypothetical protein